MEIDTKNLTKHKFTSLEIANTILEISFSRKMKLNLLKLMKLSYIVTGYCLYFDFDPMHEDIQAWKLGPVIPTIWHSFKEFGLNRNITEYDKEVDIETGKFYNPNIEMNSNEGKLINILISYLIDKYQNYSGWDLVERTHREYTPWSNVYNENERNIIIKKKDIQRFYKENFEVNLINNG